MKRSLPAQIVILLLLLAGCEHFPRAPQTIEEGLYATAKWGASLTHSINHARQQRTISRAQQVAALNVLQDAKDTVDAGLEAYRVGNYREAQSALDIAEAALRSIAVLVNRFERTGENVV